MNCSGLERCCVKLQWTDLDFRCYYYMNRNAITRAIPPAQIDIPDAHSIFIYDPNCGIEKYLRWAFVLPIKFSQEMRRTTPKSNMKLLSVYLLPTKFRRHFRMEWN